LEAASRLQADYHGYDSYGRGYLYRFQGQYDLAAAEFNKAIALQPKSGLIAFERGLLNFLQGRYGTAADDFARARGFDGDDGYEWLWLYLVRGRNGKIDASSLDAYGGRDDAENWPVPLGRFYRGEISEDAVRKAAASSDPEIERGQRCEADFYIGEWQVLHGDRSEGRKLLEIARDECPNYFIEFEIIPVELKRLAP